MKKLTLVTLISGALSASAFAGGDMNKDKISSSFQELDENGNGYIVQEEASKAGNKGLEQHFARLDSDSNDRISQDEFNTFLAQNPQHFTENVAQSDGFTTENGQSASTNTMTRQSQQYESQQDRQSSAFNNRSDRSDRGDERNAVAQNRAGQNSQSGAQSGDQWGSASDNESGYDDNIVVRSKFETIDTDGDGKISEAEARMNGINGSFTDLDEDGNDLISRMEYTEYNRNNDSRYDDE